MRAIDLDTSGAVWLYRPGSDRGPAGEHKTAYRGHSRIIPIGPRGQGILREWLRPNLTGQPIRATSGAGGFNPNRDFYLNPAAFAQPAPLTFDVPKIMGKSRKGSLK